MTAATWRNWAGNQSSVPFAVHHPTSEAEIIEVVQHAAAAGRRVKAFGAGHSFTDIALTDGDLLDLDRYDRILNVDQGNHRVKVQAGISIACLGDELAKLGMAQPNLGDIAYQSIAGAVSTATHGTGLRLGNISTQLCSMSMVLADGSVAEFSPAIDMAAFRCAQVGLGALGIISTVTLQCVPLFVLRSIEEPKPLDEILERYPDLCAENQHFEFFWFPHTTGTQMIRNNPVDTPPHPRNRVNDWFNDVLMENHVFGLVQRVGRARPALVPRLNNLTVSLISKAELSNHGYRVFANPRLVKFVEMEYAIPRGDAVAAIRELQRMINAGDLRVSFPVEVRVGAGDDAVMSTAHGRETTYIAVHMFQGVKYDRYFHEVEAIMNGFNGRPHWGKMHYQTAETLRTRYPKFDEFVALRDRLDPERRFANAYLDRVLGA